MSEGTVLRKFISQSGLWKVELRSYLLHGSTAYKLTGIQPDGRHIEKDYMSLTEATRDYDTLEAKLKKYKAPEIEA